MKNLAKTILATSALTLGAAMACAPAIGLGFDLTNWSLIWYDEDQPAPTEATSNNSFCTDKNGERFECTDWYASIQAQTDTDFSLQKRNPRRQVDPTGIAHHWMPGGSFSNDE